MGNQCDFFEVFQLNFKIILKIHKVIHVVFNRRKVQNFLKRNKTLQLITAINTCDHFFKKI